MSSLDVHLYSIPRSAVFDPCRRLRTGYDCFELYGYGRDIKEGAMIHPESCAR
jgi:hypothetical protein